MNYNNQLPPYIIAIDKRRKRKKWFLIGIVLTAMVIFFIGVFFFVTWLLESSDAYKVAKTAVYNDEEVIRLTGGVEEINMSNGSVNINNGYGKASFAIDVEGKNQDADVYIEMELEPLGNWQVTKLLKEKQ